MSFLDENLKKERTSIFLKRLLSFLFVCLFLFVAASCSKGGNPAEEALIALKRFDLTAFSACMTSASEGTLTSLRENAASLTDAEREVLTALYGTLHYTIGDMTEENDKRTVTVKASLPDLARVRALAEKKILVTADTADAVLRSMLESGEIEKSYMLDRTWQIVLTKEADAWKLSYTDKANEAFVKDLYLAEMISFLVQN